MQKQNESEQTNQRKPPEKSMLLKEKNNLCLNKNRILIPIKFISRNISVFFFSLFIFTLLISGTSNSFSQGVGIGDIIFTPDASAMLELRSTTKGLLISGMTSAQRDAIPSPEIGLLIFNTTTKSFNYYKASGWYEIESTFVSSVTGTNSPGGGVAVNQTGTAPNNSAVLDISSDTRGILVPRTTSSAIPSPAKGLIFYNNSLNRFSYFTTNWINLCDSFITTTVGSGSQSSMGVAINMTGANSKPSAIFDITSPNAGLLIPRMTTNERNIILPVAGLLIYNITTNTLDYYNGISWNRLEYNVPLTPGPITGSISVCIGQSGVNYSISSVTGASNYTWNVPSGATITSGQGTTSITVTFGSASGNVSVTANNDCGNSIAQNLSVTVTAAPTATISYTGASFCASVSTAQPVTLNGTGSYTGGTYTASPTGLSINSSTGAIIPSTSSAGTYTVTYTISGGCGVITATTIVTINSLPSAPKVLLITQPTCTVSTGSVVLSSLPSGGIWTLTQTPGGNTTTGTGISSTINGLAAGTYTYTVTDGISGCTSLPSTDVVINAQPLTPIISGTTTVCTGSTTTLTASITPGTWSSSNTGFATVNSSGVVTGIAVGVPTITYTVTSTGCVATTSVTVTSCCNNLVNNVHTDCQCIAAGGTVVSDGSGHNMCRFNASACSGGWTQYLNWCTTTAVTLSGDACSYGCCAGSPNSMTNPGHSWSNNDAHYPLVFTLCGGTADLCWDDHNWPSCGCCARAVYGNIVQIGCY